MSDYSSIPYHYNSQDGATVETATKPKSPSSVPSSLREKFDKLKKRRKGIGRHSRATRRREIIQNICSTVMKEIPVSKDDVSSDDDEKHEEKYKPTSEEIKPKETENVFNEWMIKQQEDTIIADEYDPHHKFKTKLERELNQAIDDKNYTKAEEISEKISKEKLVKKIVSKVEAKNYVDMLEVKKKKKKKKLAWNFEAKRSWERKANM